MVTNTNKVSPTNTRVGTLFIMAPTSRALGLLLPSPVPGNRHHGIEAPVHGHVGIHHLSHEPVRSGKTTSSIIRVTVIQMVNDGDQ